MALYTISGFGACDYTGIDMSGIGRRSRQERKQKRIAKRAARRTGENCKGRTGAKIMPLLIAGRRAFSALIRLNAFNLGKRIVLAFRNPSARIKILQKWCKLGGNAEKLKQTVARTEAKLKRKGKIDGYIGEPVTFSTLVATAAPILSALLPIIKQFVPAGSKAEEILDAGGEALETYASQQPDVDSGEIGQEGPTNVKTLPEVVIVAQPRKKMNWLLIAGAVGLGYMIYKRKI